MKTPAERIGAALAKAVKHTTAQMTSAIEGKKEGDAPGGEPAAAMYRTNLRDVPTAQGLSRDDCWVDMQVQFLIDKKTAGADHGVGWPGLNPGAAIATSSSSSSRGAARSTPRRARVRQAKATSSTRRAAAGTVSTTRPRRTSCWCGDGWE